MPKAREHKGISPFSDIRTVPDHARKDFFFFRKIVSYLEIFRLQ
jgi:hypothetical protein